VLPAARVVDMHVCFLFTPAIPPVPHTGGPILPPGGIPVFINSMPAGRLGDFCICVGPIDAIAAGSITVLIAKRPAARITDMTAHGGLISMGSGNVLIGGTGAGPGGMPITRLPNGDLKLGNGIIISGSPEFQALVIARLAIIASTPSGMKTLNAIDSSGKTMTIVEFTGNNSFAGPDSFKDATPAGKPVFDGNGNPINSFWGLGPQQTGTGKGSDVTVQFNPNLTLPNPTDPSNPMPNDAVLFHEMTHGAHQMNGTYDGSPVPGWTTQEEQNTISTGTPSEASYLKERGYPYKRTNHDLGYGPNP
jgi:uncharacterized Zn-binding protein involved in type VI secretion